MTPQIFDCEVRHVRTAPLRHAFAYRTYQWLVDLDHLPRRRWLASFQARDHLGDPRRSIRANVEAYLAGHGIDLDGGPIRMLTNARVLGHVFNPLSVFWCHHADGRLAAVVAEVHNTYGGRHCYLLRPGQERTDKTFYVSPFFAVDGSYRLSLPEPGPGRPLALTVALDQNGHRPFVATLRGAGRPATTHSLLAAAVRHPLVTLAVSARIKIQGIRLYARGLPVHPREVHS
ncbi:DUF1365 domain-containing protein [Mangrovihabitans endophyticus]|uniref:DUF1365 domain-containing protein n=1 Tax=Mangrovihabitans endophyticus TaxID=1751298 RepID=UPI001E63EFC3|nr:DUF1365 domain-containing protein [Mangrovihabitans endophyticus]